MNASSAPPLAAPRQLVWLLLRPTAQLTDTDAATLARLMQHADVVCARTLAHAFQAMVRQRKPEEFDAWLKACAASGIPALQSFAKGLAQEYASIRAALSEPWSSGQVEGQVNRLKLLKRQMYGRAKLDLLRQRVLHVASRHHASCARARFLGPLYPSSDPPSAPATSPKVPRGRKAGAQEGHDGHQRPLVSVERVNEQVDLVPAWCPACQAAFPEALPTIDMPRRTHVWELPEIQPHSTEHRQHTCCCPHCRQFVTADLPPQTPPGLFGPRATALIALLRGAYRLSLDDTAAFLTQVCNLPISPGCVVTSCDRARDALAPVYADIQAAVQAATETNIDETGWRLPTKAGWLWVAVARLATCFQLHPSRGHKGLRALMGEKYRGIVTSDRLRTYGLLAVDQRQLCWAHLLRDIRGLDALYGAETSWAREVLACADDLFLLWHLYKGGWIDRCQLQDGLIRMRGALHDHLLVGRVSPYPKIVAFCRELLKQWVALFTFARVEGVEPTNNGAERALRHAVLWRKGSFSSRSDAGCRFVERLLRVRATCAQQGRTLFAFLIEAITAAWANQPAPLLVQPR